MVYFDAIVAVVIVSLVSFVGVLALVFTKKDLEKILLILVAFSTGALTGDATVHLLPEAVEESGGLTMLISISFLAGILLFFVLEKFLRWRHCHDLECREHSKHLGTMNLIGDGVHNFIDGVLIGSSFLVSIPLGVTTTVAVVLHEIPQELGDFGVIVHSGYTKLQAALFNFYSATTAIIGTIGALILGSKIESFTGVLVPLTAGGFIYIALSGLVPELHKEEDGKRSFVQFIFILFGIGIMVFLLALE